MCPYRSSSRTGFAPILTQIRDRITAATPTPQMTQKVALGNRLYRVVVWWGRIGDEGRRGRQAGGALREEGSLGWVDGWVGGWVGESMYVFVWPSLFGPTFNFR